MEREIKFRAWNSRTKVMQYTDNDQTVWCGGLQPSVNTTIATSIGAQISGDFVAMQFTGLYDKNKKPIYEGDIVQRGVILFDDGKFQGFYYESNGGIAESWEDDLCQEKNIEVLGNMFENPELMLD